MIRSVSHGTNLDERDFTKRASPGSPRAFPGDNKCARCLVEISSSLNFHHIFVPAGHRSDVNSERTRRQRYAPEAGYSAFRAIESGGRAFVEPIIVVVFHCCRGHNNISNRQSCDQCARGPGTYHQFPVRAGIQQMLSLKGKLRLADSATRQCDVQLRKPGDWKSAYHGLHSGEPTLGAATQEVVELFLHRRN